MFEDRLFLVRGAHTLGGPLTVRRKRRPGAMPNGAPLLIVHGATFCALLFDLPLAGYSLMAALADSGRVVYALDVRGYGHSLGPGVLDEPPHCNPPFADADSAVEDITVAADFVLAQQQSSNLDLIGFSWGAITAARFAGAHADKVARLALYAPIYSSMRPIWPTTAASNAGEEPHLDAYRLVSETGILARWDADLPAGGASQFREDAVPRALFDVVAALDPRSRSRNPPAFRCPNGALRDLMRIFAGKRAFDPG